MSKVQGNIFVFGKDLGLACHRCLEFRFCTITIMHRDIQSVVLGWNNLSKCPKSWKNSPAKVSSSKTLKGVMPMGHAMRALQLSNSEF